MAAAQLTIHGNQNAGLFIFANDKFCLIGKDVEEDDEKTIAEVLDVPTYRVSIAGSSLLGVFVAGNNKGIIAPNIILDTEKEELMKICKQHDVKFTILNTTLTALGNVIACNNVAVDDYLD